MSKGTQIDWCPVERVDALRRFIDAHWSKGHVLATDTELLRWQYRNGEDADTLSVLVATEGGEFLGILGLIPVSFGSEGARHSGAMLAMWVTREDQRNRPLGLELLRDALARDFAFVGVLGFNATAGRVFKAMRFSVCERVPRWARAFDRERMASLLDLAGKDFAARTKDAWIETGNAVGGDDPPRGVRLVEWTAQTARAWEEAWRVRFAPRLRGVYRDAAYLRWRYLEHPRFGYTLRFAQDAASGEMTGLLVYRLAEVRDRPERVMRIVELLGEPAAMQGIAAEVCRVATEQRVAFADFYCSTRVFASQLERHGFVEEATQPGHLPSLFQPLDFRRTALNGAFLVRPPMGSDSAEYFASPNLYVTRSDGDQDRPN